MMKAKVKDKTIPYRDRELKEPPIIMGIQRIRNNNSKLQTTERKQIIQEPKKSINWPKNQMEKILIENSHEFHFKIETLFEYPKSVNIQSSITYIPQTN